MDTWIGFVAFIAVWFVLQAWVLPKLAALAESVKDKLTRALARLE